MKAETPAETPAAEVAEVCRVNKYIYVYNPGRVQMRFDCDLGCAEFAGPRGPSCNSRGWFIFFGEPASIEELTCINRS